MRYKVCNTFYEGRMIEMKRSVVISGVVIVVLVFGAALIWHAVVVEDRAGKLTVSFLNVGQGDAIFIDAPSGRQVLIDGGRNRAVLRELSRVSRWYDRSIDVVIATHPDLDHIGGLVDVLARYRVSTIVHTSVRDEEGTDSEAFERAAKEETEHGAKIITAERGQIIDLGSGAYLEILSPDRDVPRVDTNMGCVVARLVYGETAFMLSCDAPQAIENYLVRLDGSASLTTGGSGLKSNVLKAGHHGSRTSSSALFVGFVDPEYAVFSRGCDNTYGHPHQEVVDLFKRFEIPTLDTCTDGTVTFVSDGRTVRRR